MAELKITKENFEEAVLQNRLPVLVDFWATWCGPCRMLAPVLEQLAEEYAETAVIGKINVDEEPELANRFGITSIPTILLFKDGQVSATSVGYRPKEQLEALLR